jgi:hypothetical protein
MIVLLINISADNSVDIIMGMHWAYARVSVSLVHMDVQCGASCCGMKSLFSFDEHYLKQVYQCEHVSYFVTNIIEICVCHGTQGMVA